MVDSARRRKRSRSARRRRHGGDGLSARALRAKYQNILPPVMERPPTFRQSRDELNAMSKRNIGMCQSKFKEQIPVCQAVPFWNRKACANLTQQIADLINKRTNELNSAVTNFAHECADKDLDQEKFQKCAGKIAQTLQEYVAQCSDATNILNLQFGNKTIQARKAVAMGAIKRAVDYLPFNNKRKKQEEIEMKQKQKEALLQAFEKTLDEFIQKCERLPTLDYARGMEDYGFTCNQIRGIKEGEKQPLIDEMLSKVK